MAGSSSGGIVGTQLGGSIQYSVALNSSVTGDSAGRIAGSGGTLAGNYAIAIGTMTGAGAADGKDGLLITLAGSAADQAIFGDTAGSVGAGWKFLVSPTDTDPWVWDSASNLPILYWQVRP